VIIALIMYLIYTFASVTKQYNVVPWEINKHAQQVTHLPRVHSLATSAGAWLRTIESEIGAASWSYHDHRMGHGEGSISVIAANIASEAPILQYAQLLSRKSKESDASCWL